MVCGTQCPVHAGLEKKYVPLHRPGSKFLKEAVSKFQWRALTVSACNAVGPPYRPSMSWDRSTDAWTTLEATTAFIATNVRHQRRREAPSSACRCYAAPDSSDDTLRTSTILPVTPPLPSISCACLASARGNRRAISGLIFCCRRSSKRAIKSCRNNAGFSRLSHWML